MDDLTTDGLAPPEWGLIEWALWLGWAHFWVWALEPALGIWVVPAYILTVWWPNTWSKNTWKMD